MTVLDLMQAPEQCASSCSWHRKVDFHLPPKEKLMQKQTNANKFQILFLNANSF